MSFHILDLLEKAASQSESQGITTFPLNCITKGRYITYKELYALSKHKSSLLRSRCNIKRGSIVLIHLDDHLENIVWFWAVVLAGAVPALSIPFSKIKEQRIKHIEHVASLLEDPTCLTQRHLLSQFDGQTSLLAQTVDEIESQPLDEKESIAITGHGEEPAIALPAMLLFTSGSTGNSKAVVLTHEMIHASLCGKLDQLGSRTHHKSILNWIGFDHVAAWETHFLSLFICGRQVQVAGADLIANPLRFLQLIDEHKVCRTFAPHFFLSRLKKALESAGSLNLDLSCLDLIVSGGEANDLRTCLDLQQLLSRYGARKDVIVPAFGMTETFAGSINNLHILDQDAMSGQFAALGSCVPCMEMRVVLNGETVTNVSGDLQVRGENVFKGYYRNPEATASSFTHDGWFLTGDQGLIDQQGCLHLTGRSKDFVMINAVKYNPYEIELAVDMALIPGVSPNHTVCFSYHNPKTRAESLGVVFLPKYAAWDTDAAVQTYQAILKAVIAHTGARPYVLPLNAQILQHSSLGKLSRTKIKAAFESKTYEDHKLAYKTLIQSYHSLAIVQPSTAFEKALHEAVSASLQISSHEFGIDTPFLDMGITSVELLSIKSGLEAYLARPIHMGTILQNPTVRALSQALSQKPTTDVFNPVVVLQGHGAQPTPLWLIHPGDGDVLIYWELAKRLDRPVYALRACGLVAGESPFTTIAEAAETYADAIVAQQPRGPYTLASHCYGAMLAFEVAKLLQAGGREVRFLGVLNLPPRIKIQMRLLDWVTGLVHLSYFIKLVEEEKAEAELPALRQRSRDEALRWVFDNADPQRWRALGLAEADLERWANVAYELHAIATEYEPSGVVPSVDVLYAEPLKAAWQGTKEEWAEGPLREWTDFSSQEVRLHVCPGTHHGMIGPEHVNDLKNVLQQAMKARGV